MVTLAIAVLLAVPSSGSPGEAGPQGQPVRVLAGLPEAPAAAEVTAFAEAVEAVLRSGSGVIRLAETGDADIVTVRVLAYGPIEGGGSGSFAVTSAVTFRGAYHLENLTAGAGSTDPQEQARGYVALLVQTVHKMTERPSK